jgi:hypothetical protein
VVTYKGKCNRCFLCPLCHCVLVSRRVYSNSAESAGVVALCCGYCDYSSAACGITDTDAEGLEMQVLARERENVNEEVFKLILAGHQRTPGPTAGAGDVSSPPLSPPPPVKDPRADDDGSKVPGRVPLSSKHLLRCRADQAANKMSILVNPKLNPLEGDSGNRQTISRGKWFIKDLSAVSLFPFITVLSSSWNNGIGTVSIRVSNPVVDHAVNIALSGKNSNRSTWADGFEPFDGNAVAVRVGSLHASEASDGSPAIESLRFALDAFEDEYLRDEPMKTPSPAVESQNAVSSTGSPVSSWWVVEKQYHSAVVAISIACCASATAETTGAAIESGVCVLPLTMEVARSDEEPGKFICCGNLLLCLPTNE